MTVLPALLNRRHSPSIATEFLRSSPVVWLREREVGADVILVLTYSDRALVFLTDEYGKLLNATMLDAQPHRMNVPERRFGDELFSWLKWAEESERAKTEQADRRFW